MSQPFSEALADIPPTLAPDPFTYKPLDHKQARWYWMKPPFKAADAKGAPLDIPHRAHITRFCSADSDALEEAYRQRKDELEAAWWQEHSELTAGPAPAKSPAKPSSPSAKPSPASEKHGGASPGTSPPANMNRTVLDVAARRQELLDREVSATSWKEFQEAPVEQVGTLVRGGLWEVDLLLRLLSPCYWPEAQHRVMRGTWFVEKGQDWVPLRETLADELETAYRSEVWHPSHRHLAEQQGGLVAARVDLASSSQKGLYALFSSAGEAYLCRDDTYAWFSRKMGSKEKGMRLRRGYEQPRPGSMEVDARAEEGDEAAAAQPVDRLVLAVHGIGQKLAGANIVDDAATLRALVRSAASETESAAAAGGSGGRVEVLPVQWRKGLNLGVDELARSLMPANLEALRGILHATAVEVLLYLTPLHCQDMLDSVVTSLNATVAKFMARNPGFQGGISIVAHSLGSVLTWDILSCQPRLYSTLAAHHLTPQGAADTSVAALERLAGATGPLRGSTTETTGSTVGEPPNGADADALTGSSPSGSASMLMDVQPLTSADLDVGHITTEAAAAAKPSEPDAASASQALDAASEQQQEQSQESGGGGGDGVGDARSAASSADPQVQQLQAEVAELRRRLQATSAQRDQLSPANAAAQQAGGSEAAGLAIPVKISPLNFSVDQYVAIGSPLGLFLALRKVDPNLGAGLGTPSAARLMPGGGGGCDGLPAVNRAYNLYQPYDPIAYRMEPLAVAGGEKRRPLFAPYHRGGRRIHIGIQEGLEDIGSAVGGFGSNVGRVTGSMWGSVRSGLGRAAAAVQVAKADGSKEAQDGSQAVSEAKQQSVDEEVRARADEPGTAFWRLTDGRGSADDKTAAGRIDFVLQDSPTENPYLSAISSHFSYWTSPDTALLLARAVSGLDVLTGRAKGHRDHKEGDKAAEAAAGSADGGGGGGGSRTPAGGSPRAASPRSPPPQQVATATAAPALSPHEALERAWHSSGV